MTFLDVFGSILAGALLAGAASGLLGVVVVGLRVPFLVMCTAHTALAGAVFAQAASRSPTLGAFLGAVLGGMALGALSRDRRIDVNIALGTVFSLSMGLVFLGVALTPGPKTRALGLLWGSLLFLTPGLLTVLGVCTLLLLLFLFVFESKLKVLLFNRELAASLFSEGVFLTCLLVLASAVIAVCLQITGGLMLYALISNPAVAALKVTRSWRGALALSALLGSGSALGGFFSAYWLNLPLGTCIVLVSSVLLFLFSAGAGLHSPAAGPGFRRVCP